MTPGAVLGRCPELPPARILEPLQHMGVDNIALVIGLDMRPESDAAVVQDWLDDRGAALGTSDHLDGVAYDKLGVTGHRVSGAADAAARHLGLPLVGARGALQGFGPVGRPAPP